MAGSSLYSGLVRPGTAGPCLLRSIPAQAGESEQCDWSRTTRGVYPRAGGGEPRSMPFTCPCVRVYPRMGGGSVCRGDSPVESDGLSPHGRGNRNRPGSGLILIGSIPAWAGKSRPRFHSWAEYAVYPRMGGEIGVTRFGNRGLPGLSPHGRGNRSDQIWQQGTPGSIPAWAGKSTNSRPNTAKTPVYPRMGGEITMPNGGTRPLPGLSPHGRGNLHHGRAGQSS